MKASADSIVKTNLEETLSKLGASEPLVCGMTTQDCVTCAAA